MSQRCEEPAHFGTPVDTSDLELREGKRACERGVGPPQKCGALDLQKLADAGERTVMRRWGTLCGSWWTIREVELSTARCLQVSFLKGDGCGRCVFLPVTKTDPKHLARNVHMLAHVQLLLQALVLVPGQGCTKAAPRSTIAVQSMRIRSQK